MNIDTQNINKKQKYEIIISSDGNLDSIGWGYRLSHHNNYYDGNLYIDNKKYESDLAIKVYNQYKGNYFTAKQYFIIFLILILLEYIVIKKQNIK